MYLSDVPFVMSFTTCTCSKVILVRQDSTDIPRIWFCISDSKIRGMFWVEQVTAAILGVSNASQEGISADERN